MKATDDSMDFKAEESALKRAVKALWMVMKPTFTSDSDGRSTESLL